MSEREKHLASLHALRATRTAKRNAALLTPLADALEYLLGGEQRPAQPPAADADDSDTESVSEPVPAALPAPVPIPEPAGAPVGSFSVELAPPVPESRAAALASREKESRKRLNKGSSKAEIERRARRIMREPPRGEGRGSTDSATVQALRSEDPKVFHVNLFV